jgi:hypothetical protein
MIGSISVFVVEKRVHSLLHTPRLGEEERVKKLNGLKNK